MSTLGYMVYIEGMGGPAVTHPTYEQAEAELRRLLVLRAQDGRATKRSGYVLEIRKRLTATPKWEIEE
jgi:hypothetical protein